MKKNLVSVVMPTYNRANLIESAIKSVLDQTYSNIEMIVVDDCSTDNTFDVVRKIGDKRVKYYKLKKNSGSNVARNYGIRKARGEFITFIDSDDIYINNKIELQLNKIISTNTDMNFCGVKILDNDKEILVPNELQLEKIAKEEYNSLICSGNFISTQALFVKSDILKRINFDNNLPRLQDYDLVLRLIPEVSISFVNEFLVNLFRQEDSISNSNSKLLLAAVMMYSKNYNYSIADVNILKNNLFNIIKEISGYIIFLEQQFKNYKDELNHTLRDLDCLKNEISVRDKLIQELRDNTRK